MFCLCLVPVKRRSCQQLQRWCSSRRLRPSLVLTIVFSYTILNSLSAELNFLYIYSNNYLHFNGHFSKWAWVSQYQNVSILDFIEAKDDGGGGDNWSYKMCKAPVKSSPPTPNFLEARCPSCRQTNSVIVLKERLRYSTTTTTINNTSNSLFYRPSFLKHLGFVEAKQFYIHVTPCHWINTVKHWESRCCAVCEVAGLHRV